MTNLQNQKWRKKINSHVHVILISHVYVSVIISVSNGWKSRFGENIKFGDITDMFNKWRSRSPIVVLLTVLQNSKENIYVGVLY